jgi:hypothetical protein
MSETRNQVVHSSAHVNKKKAIEMISVLVDVVGKLKNFNISIKN